MNSIAEKAFTAGTGKITAYIFSFRNHSKPQSITCLLREFILLVSNLFPNS